MAANITEENLMEQLGNHGNMHLLIDEIEDYRTNEEAILSAQGTYKTKYGFDRNKRTTKRWEFSVKWKDGYGDWVAMKDLKDSYPVPLADYSMSNILQDEPVFAWWVPYILKKHIAVISKIKTKYWKKNHKYGIQVLNNVR